MTAKAPDAHTVAWQVHELASRLMDAGCCPACLAQSLIDEGCFLAEFTGDIAIVQEVVGRYGMEPLRKH